MQDTSSARLTDQESAINSAIEAGTAAKNAAITRIRAAREAGDFSAEMEASTEFNAAEYRLNRAKDVKANFEANFEAWKAKQPKPGERRQPVQQAGQPTSEAQKWLDDHPRYYADDDYKADAIASHNLAMEKNIPEGSKAYIAFIEARMERLYGDDHGRIGGPAREAKPNGGTVTNGRQTQRSASSTAAPPSRSSSSSGGGGSIEYTHPQGSIRLVTILNDKGQHVETVQGIIPTEWRNAAQWTGMDDVQYAVSQLKIQQEIKSGQLGGLAYGESGVKFRFQMPRERSGRTTGVFRAKRPRKQLLPLKLKRRKRRPSRALSREEVNSLTKTERC